MTPEERAVLKAAKAWVAEHGHEIVDEVDHLLKDAVEALEPPKPEEVPRLPRGAYLDKDGQLCMADDDGWLMYFGSLDSLSPAAAMKYAPYTLLEPARDPLDVDLVRRLVDHLASASSGAHMFYDPRNGVHSGTWADCPADSCSTDRTLIAEARAQIGGAS